MTTGLKTRSPHGRTNVGNLVGGHPPNCLTSPTILAHHKQTIPAEASAQSGDLQGPRGIRSRLGLAVRDDIARLVTGETPRALPHTAPRAKASR